MSEVFDIERSNDFVTLNLVLEALDTMDTLSASEFYSYNLIRAHLKDLIKNWRDRTERARDQFKVKEDL